MAYITYELIMEIAETDPNLKKTFQGVVHQVVYGATGTAIGGLVGGPVGALLGGIAGSAVGYWTVNDYDSMIKVLQNMNDAERQRFVKEVVNVVGSSVPQVLRTFVQTEANRKLLLDVFKRFS